VARGCLRPFVRLRVTVAAIEIAAVVSGQSTPCCVEESDVEERWCER